MEEVKGRGEGKDKSIPVIPVPFNKKEKGGGESGDRKEGRKECKVGKTEGKKDDSKECKIYRRKDETYGRK